MRYTKSLILKSNIMSKETNKQLTPEEAKARRAEITKFYKEQIPHLKVQAEYERLMTEIEENRAKRVQAQAFMADAYMQMENAKEGEAAAATTEQARQDFEGSMSQQEEPKRKLKRVVEDE